MLQDLDLLARVMPRSGLLRLSVCRGVAKGFFFKRLAKGFLLKPFAKGFLLKRFAKGFF